MLRTIQQYYAKRVSAQETFAVLRDETAPFALTIDLLDFESFVHTIDCWLSGTNESRMLERILCRGDIFFDVGANQGLYSLFAAARGGEHTRVVAFEPQPRVAEALQRSIDANMFQNVVLVQEAVSSSIGETSFFVPAFGSGTASLSHAQAARNGSVQEIRCATTTLDHYVESNGIARIDIMKMDVEGFEASVLEGGSDTITRSHPIIWFEVNPLALAAAGSSQQRCIDLLRAYGYDEFYDVDSLLTKERKPIVATVSGLTNVVAIHSSRRSRFWDALGSP